VGHVQSMRWAMLTYLHGPASKYLRQRAQRLAAVALMARRPLAVQVAARLAPCQVVDDGELVSPEDGGAVGHGQDARVDEAFERAGPLFARAEGGLRPAAR